MHEYDIALKRILTRKSASLIRLLTGLEIAEWVNPELPDVRERRADLLGETVDGQLLHVELQSTNDPRMARRMLEYAVSIKRVHGRYPEQLVVYAGSAPLRMETGVAAGRIRFECRIADIRALDGESLLASRDVDDAIIAVLARFADQPRALRTILHRIAEGGPERRSEAVAELLILAGLRGLGDTIRKEIQRMPILDDILDHDYLGPILRSARAEGERSLIASMIGKRFGSLPSWAAERLDSLSSPELDALGLRLLDVSTVEELFG